jgi:hypothetical protein
MSSNLAHSNLAHNDDLAFCDRPAQDVKIDAAQPLLAPSKSPFLLKLFLAFALLLTLAWDVSLGWGMVRLVLSNL